MKRREFLGTSVALGLAITRPQTVLALDPDNKYRREIGIQLYTLRDQIKDDVRATLKAVADAGYQQVEPYGFPDAGPIMDAAKEYGLAVHSSHFAADSVVHPDKQGVMSFAEVLEQAHEAGLTHLVIPYLQDKDRQTLDDYRRLAQRCNEGAELAKQAGIQLAYHNHAFEFKPMKNGKTGYDVMIEEFSPDMKFEVDVFWIQVGGRDPVELIRTLKGRVSQLHLKDSQSQHRNPELRIHSKGGLRGTRGWRDLDGTHHRRC